MILMQENPFQGPMKGVCPETIFGPVMVTSKASAIWAQKSGDFQSPPLQMCPE